MDQAAGKTERRIPAIAVSRGVGIGRVVFLHGEKQQFFRIDLEQDQIDGECQRLQSAVETATQQLKKLTANDGRDANLPVSSIFGAHLLIIEESSLVQKVLDVIRNQLVNAEWAVKTVSDHYLEKQVSVADIQFQEKFLDIEDVSQRLLSALNGSASSGRMAYHGAVVVARELRPSSVMELARNKPVALVTERGGWTSHASILAREFKLPMVSGVRNLDKAISQGDTVIVDSINGEVILDPTNATLEHFHAIASENRSLEKSLPADNGPATTKDGTRIVIKANADAIEAYRLASHLGAEGIGLFRSESLIAPNGSLPSEDEQISAYTLIAELAGEAGVRIRTFDIGTDQLTGAAYSAERNPSMGLRSIRLSLTHPEHFRTQLRAIIRASANFSAGILLPMISGVGEVMLSKEIIAEERDSLIKKGIPVGDPKVGAMIEIPSAVFTAAEIAENVDFLCLGTNDLVQYLLAVDRDNDSVADWYQTLHPAVISAIGKVLTAADEAGIQVTVCGEMAGSSFYVPLLIGLGARELSMNVNSLELIRHLVRGITLKECVDLVESIRSCRTAGETETALNNFYLQNWISLFPPGLLDSKHS